MTPRISLQALFGSSIGFDRYTDFFETLDRATELGTSYPPYDIERVEADRYAITLAVAGFTEAELNITVQDNALTITGQKTTDDQDKIFLFKGITGCEFKQVFRLADFVTVTDAALKDGLLHVTLVREIPEAKKPKRVAITARDYVNSLPAANEDASLAA